MIYAIPASKKDEETEWMPLRTIGLSIQPLDGTRFPVHPCPKSIVITIRGEKVIVRLTIPNDISEELTIAELGRWNYRPSDILAIGLSSAVAVRGSHLFFLRYLDYPWETTLDDEFVRMAEGVQVPELPSGCRSCIYDEKTGRIVLYSRERSKKTVLFDTYWAY